MCVRYGGSMSIPLILASKSKPRRDLLFHAGICPTIRVSHVDEPGVIAKAAGLPEVAAEIQKYVDRANTNVSRAESVRKFIVLPTTFSQDNKCLTPSMKVVRPKVNQVFKEQIDNQLYVGKR